jgi:hypothetical protein
MNLFSGEAADDFFGGAVPTAVRHLLHRAAAEPAERTATLWAAQSLAPHCLAVYYVLVKHHATRHEFDWAERAARRGLSEAAEQAGLPLDWSAAQPEPSRDFGQGGPARFWLFMLKALAFLALQQDRPQAARALLAKITELQPDAAMGDEVVGAMLQATQPRSGRS